MLQWWQAILASRIALCVLGSFLVAGTKFFGDRSLRFILAHSLGLQVIMVFLTSQQQELYSQSGSKLRGSGDGSAAESTYRSFRGSRGQFPSTWVWLTTFCSTRPTPGPFEHQTFLWYRHMYIRRDTPKPMNSGECLCSSCVLFM